MPRGRALHGHPPSATEALLVRIHDYAESSAVVVLLTADRGAVRAVAKGARRLRNSFLGPLDKGVLYRVRLGRRGGDGLVHLNTAEVREGFASLRRRPTGFLAATLVLEVASDLMREDEANPDLFRLTVFTLKALERAPDGRVPLAVTIFLARCVALSGHAPEIDACVACGRPIGEDETPLIGPLRGGVLHAACAQGEPGARSVRPAVLDLLAAFWRRPAGELLAAHREPGPLRELRALLVLWLEISLDRRFHAAAPLEAEFATAGGGRR